MRAMISRTSKGLRVSTGITPYSSCASNRGATGATCDHGLALCLVQVLDGVARDRQRMHVVLGQMVDHAGQAGMHIAAAQVLGAHDFAGGGLDQWRAAQKDRALVAHDDALVAHRRHIGATGRATAHDHGNLGDALRAEVGLVEEDAAEMVAVRKHLVLVRQVGAARVDQVDARQAVLLRDLLRAQMLLDRQRVVGAALDRRVVAHDHAIDAADPADAGDQAGAGRAVAAIAIGVHAQRGQRTEFQKRRARDRAASAPDRAAAACRAPCVWPAPPRRRRSAPGRSAPAGRPPGPAWPGRCAGSRWSGR